MKAPLDLRFGNPVFLQSYWENLPTTPTVELPMGYTKEGLDSLKESICNLHRRYQNVDYKDKHIIIGNGATQLLAAAFVSYNPEGYLTAEHPHFPRFPGIAEYVQIPFVDWDDRNKYKAIQIITSPNNPDGKYQNTPKSNYILDASYNWPQYVQFATDYSKGPIVIFSAAKALGLASSRVGWAFVEDKDVAYQMQQYIEMTTSGVSVDGQARVQLAIEQAMESISSPFAYGASVLASRWKQINYIKQRLPFEIISDNGMFLWAFGDGIKTFFKERDILVVDGEDCGVYDNEYVRVNIGCSNSDFIDLIERIK